MLKWIIIFSVTASLLVLALAAVLKPSDLPSISANSEAPKNIIRDADEWCEAMEDKPNAQWQGDDFENFSKHCL